MRPLLWIGDAVADTGFARCTHKILETVSKHWKVSVLGLNYRGDPHPYPYDIYSTPVIDGFGLKKLGDVYRRVRPEIVVVQNDPWNVPAYVKQLPNVPVVANMPVDGRNCRGRALNGIRLAIFWTQFGLDEARRGGYTGPAAIIPLGVDLNVYKQLDRATARRFLGLPAALEDAFIVGNVNRNQPRKRIDLTIAYFAEWVKRYNINNAYLFLHVAPTGDSGVDAEQLAAYYGIQKRLILSDPGVLQGVEERRMAEIYSALDVQVNTAQGEGWGLTTMEGMACGVPQVIPDWSALGEWCEDAAIKIPCSNTITTMDGINVIGGIPDREDFIYTLQALYTSEDFRRQYINAGLELVQRPEFRWDFIGERFATALQESEQIPLVLEQQRREREAVNA